MYLELIPILLTSVVNKFIYNSGIYNERYEVDTGYKIIIIILKHCLVYYDCLVIKCLTILNLP